MAAYDAKRTPLLLLAPVLLVGAGMFVPVAYLVIRAAGADMDGLAALAWRPRTLRLIVNTVMLMLGVIVATTAIAFPAAWLVTRADIGCQRLLTTLSVLPLAIPGYVMGFALIGLGGYYGFFNQFLGIRLARPEGFVGAVLALSLYTFPYLFLNLRSALSGMDPGLEESARSLGHSPWEVFFSVTLQHMLPALFSGWLVIGLYVLGDFGVVSLMRFDTFSSAIYNQYANAYERHYAAWLSLMLLAIAFVLLFLDGFWNRRRRLARVGSGVARRMSPVSLGWMRPLAWLFFVALFMAALGLPATAIVFWLSRVPVAVDWFAVWLAAIRTVGIAMPAAVCATALALSVSLLSVCYPSRLARGIERLAYFGYAVPPLPFALAMVFLSLAIVPFLYQTLFLVICTYVFSFLALASGPLRSALLQGGGRREEAGRSLGCSSGAVFWRITLPPAMRAVVSGGLLVFLVAVKELPIALLLSPPGYATLAMTVFSRTEEGMLFDAAPYALLMVLFSACFIGLAVRYESEGRA